MTNLVAYLGPREEVIDPETGAATGEVVMPGGGAIVEGHVDLTPDQVAELAALISPSLDQRKARALAALAARRWQAETGGIIVGGLAIKTDEDTQRKITGAYVKADKDAGFTVQWKVDAGVFVTLDAAIIVAVGDAVTAHIQSCFENEADLSTLIVEAGDEAALAAIDIESGWPG